MKRHHPILSLGILFGGLIVSTAAASLWLVLRDPPRTFIDRTQQVLQQLHQGLGHVRQQTRDLPLTLQATRTSLTSAAQSVTALHATLRTGVDESLLTLDSLKQDATIIAEFGKRARGLADATSRYWLPLPEATRREFHKLRDALYQTDQALKMSARSLGNTSDALRLQVLSCTRPLHQTLDDSASALRLYERQVQGLETGLVPRFAAWLDTAASAIETIPALLHWAKRAAITMILLGLGTGAAFAGLALRSLLSSTH